MPDMTVLSVSQFVDTLNNILVQALPAQTFEIEGEVASFTISQGQWVRFDLKDKDALVNCFLPLYQLKEQLADGMKIAVTGQAKVYGKYGKLSFVVSGIRLSGEGSLKRAFELLKKKLENEGLFAPERKRVLPRFPERVALITSREAAAYTDFLRVASGRWPRAEIFHYHVGVQGERAIEDVAGALSVAGADPDAYDVIVLTRGGGSMDELHVFNTEAVARAVFGSRVPVVSAIGHERDITIVDFVADVRAATPSNAAEIIFPQRADVAESVRRSSAAQYQRILRCLADDKARVVRGTHAADQWLKLLTEQVRTQTQLLARAFDSVQREIFNRRDQILHARRLMDSLHPRHVLERGYSYTRDTKGRIIGSAREMRPGEIVEQVYRDGTATVRVENI